MSFWVTFALWAATTIASDALARKQIKDIPPPDLDNFQIPTVDEGRAIPVAYGTNKISPALMWYGDLALNPITEKVRAVFSKKRVTTGYQYLIGQHLVPCVRADAITEIRVGEKIAWTGSAMDTTITVDEPELLGPADREGGVGFTVDIGSGSATQTVNTYLAGQLGSDTPAYRHCVSVIIRGGSEGSGYLGNSPNPRPISLVTEFFPTALGTATPNINGGANPAEILYDIWTSDDYGFGQFPSEIDVPSLQAIGVALANEGFGMSFKWDTQREKEDVEAEILRSIDAVRYIDPVTKLMTIKLIRDDYNIATIPSFDETSFKVLSFSRIPWHRTANEISVSFVDRTENFLRRVVKSADLANRNIVGGVRPAKFDFLGIDNGATAVQAASREQKAISYPFATAQFQFNRLARNLRPGDVFLADSDELETDIVYRVVRSDYGILTSGRIIIDAVQDVYSTGNAISSVPVPSAWQNPIVDAQPAPIEAVRESAYWQLLEFIDPDRPRPITVATKPPAAQGYDIEVDAGVEGQSVAFTPSGTLNLAYPQNTLPLDTVTQIEFSAGSEIGRLITAQDFSVGDNLFLINDEYMQFLSITDLGLGNFRLNTILRGLLDTVQQVHAIGDRIWFVSYGLGVTDNRSYGDNDVLNVKILPETPTGVLPSASATNLPIGFTTRPRRPLPPGNLRINGAFFPATVAGNIAVTWSHRDRTQQPSVIRQDNTANIGPETGVTYTVRVYGDNILRRTVTGLTGTAYTYTAAFEAADGGPFTSFRIELEAVNGALVSHQFQSRSFTR